MGGFDVVNARFQRISRVGQLMPATLSAWFTATAWGEHVQRSLLEQLLGADHVFFVQIGANTGANPNDPIYQLVRARRWKGILVEPVPSVFEKLKQNYSSSRELIFEQAAISDESNAASGTVELCVPLDMFMADTDGKDAIHYSQFSSIESTRSGIAHAHKKISVPCLTFPTLLAKHGIESVDLLVTDTEGHDYFILSSIDLSSGTKPRVILFEHFYMTSDEYADLTSRLGACGYAVLWIDAMDSLAVLEASNEELQLLLARTRAATRGSELMKDILSSESFAARLRARSKQVAALTVGDVHAAVVEPFLRETVPQSTDHAQKQSITIDELHTQLGDANMSVSQLRDALRDLQAQGVLRLSANGTIELAAPTPTAAVAATAATATTRKSSTSALTASDGVGAQHMGGFDVVNARFQRISQMGRLMPPGLSAWFTATAWGEHVQRFLLEELLSDDAVFFVQVRHRQREAFSCTASRREMRAAR